MYCIAMILQGMRCSQVIFIWPNFTQIHLCSPIKTLQTPHKGQGLCKIRGSELKPSILQNEAPNPTEQADNLQNKGFGPCKLRSLPAIYRVLYQTQGWGETLLWRQTLSIVGGGRRVLAGNNCLIKFRKSYFGNLVIVIGRVSSDQLNYHPIQNHYTHDIIIFKLFWENTVTAFRALPN